MIQFKEPLFHGAASEVLATFRQDGTIDFDLMANEIEFLLANGITGLFLNGLASEALLLNNQERQEIAKFCIGVIKHRVPVMINVAQNYTAAAIQEAQAYEKLGPDALIVVSPVVYKYTEQGLYDHFTKIGQSVKLPMYIYNAPETGNKLSPALAARIFNANPNFRGYKDSTQNIIEQQTLLRLLDKDRPFELICGSDAQTATTMMTGGTGVISLLSVVFPQPVIDVCQAAERKDWPAAFEKQARVLKIREAMKTGPFLAAYKYVSTKTGTPLGCMRAPLVGLSDGEKEKIEKVLKEEGLL